MTDIESEQENTHPALQIEEVVEHVFSFLELKEIKNCRLVSSSWNFVGNKFMRRKTRIRFKFQYNNEEIISENREKMIEISRAYILANRDPNQKPFAAFEFDGVIPIALFVTFMRKNSSCVRELKIFGVLKDTKNPTMKSYDISQLLDPCLRTLYIDWNSTSFKYHISTKSILSVEKLELGICGIIMDGNEKRVSPIEITLEDTVIFLRDGVQITDCLLNEIFDFRKTEYIHFDGNSEIIDFGLCADNINLPKISRSVEMINIKVRNWEQCNWKVHSLTLEDVPFTNRNKMEIKNFECVDGIVDLSMIHDPKAISSISLQCKTELKCQKSFFFPNMTTLCLKEECLQFLHYFSQHGSIAGILLIATFDDGNDIERFSVNVKDLPKELLLIQLQEVEIKGDTPYPIHLLHLFDYELIERFQYILTKFLPKYVYVLEPDILNLDIDKTIDFINKPKNFQFLVLGRFDWSELDFYKSKFSDIAKRKAEYYLICGYTETDLPEGDENCFIYSDSLVHKAPRFVRDHMEFIEMDDDLSIENLQSFCFQYMRA